MIPENFSEKQKYALKNSDARINIWEGAVRSGKSYSSLMRWIEYIKDCKIEGDFLCVGRTKDTIERNIVNPLMELFPEDLTHFSGKRELHLWGKKMYLVGASDDRAQGKIQGNEFAGAYMDEGSLLPQGFFKMLLSRLFKDEAKLFVTTNPDSPFHWLKTEYIDRPDLDIKTFKFVLDDNPVITESFKKNISKEYTGLWYKRYILGEWTLAEGTVYDFFDEDIHVIESPPGIASYYNVGVDYGTSNPTAFVLVGYNPSTYPNMWVEKEYYYDSRKKMRQKTDAEYAKDLKDFIEGYLVDGIYVDPSAVSFKAELYRAKIDNICDVKNDVLDGIRFVGTLLNQGTLKIVKRCKNLIKEIQTYRWDERSIKLGEDKPLKENDHCLDAARYIIFSRYYGKDGDGGISKEHWRDLKYKHSGSKPNTIEDFMRPGW